MKKWLKRIGIGIAVIFLILLILPFAFKGKILKMAQESASTSVNAKISFDDDLSISLIRNFPNLSVGVNNLKVIGIVILRQPWTKGTNRNTHSISCKKDMGHR